MNTLKTIRPELTKKIAVQGIPLLIGGAAFLYCWHVLKKTGAAHTLPAPRMANTLPTLLSDLNLILPISALAVLFGIACAFYVEEWLPATRWRRRFIETQVAFFAEIPSLLYGLFAISLRYTLQRNAATLWTEAGIFILMVMPIAIQTTQAALRSVALPIREATYALGATRWHVLTKQVVPLAFPRMLAGGCRAMSRALAAAALLIGIHIPNALTTASGIPHRFMVFFGGALLLSTLASLLNGLSTNTTTAQHAFIT